jgi:hypothetical protein
MSTMRDDMSMTPGCIKTGKYAERRQAFEAWLDYAVQSVEKKISPDAEFLRLKESYLALEKSHGDLADPAGTALSFEIAKHRALRLDPVLSRHPEYAHLHSIACEISTRHYFTTTARKTIPMRAGGKLGGDRGQRTSGR